MRQAALIRSSVHHRSLKLHRPFMALGYRQPEMYGISVQRSLESADALVQEAKLMSKRGWLSARDRIQRYYLFQACLAFITDLWYRPRPLNDEHRADEETRALQENLKYIIDKLKDEGPSTEGSVLRGASANLEKLLAATISRKSSVNDKDSLLRRGSEAPSQLVARESAAGEDNTDNYLPQDGLFGMGGAENQGMIDLLDAQLMRLSEIAPHSSLVTNSMHNLDGFGAASSSSGSDIASLMGIAAPSSHIATGGIAGEFSIVPAGPAWDQNWTDIFETLDQTDSMDVGGN